MKKFNRVFDRDNNGYITLDELQRAMQMIGENVTDAQLNEMLALADLDKDGKINYEGECRSSHETSKQFLISLCFFRVRKIAVVKLHVKKKTQSTAIRKQNLIALFFVIHTC